MKHCPTAPSTSAFHFLGKTTLLACTLVAWTGCAGFPYNLPGYASSKQGDLRPELQQRKANVASSMETRRNEAQYEAACNRLDAGDLAGARQDLYAILRRDPGFGPAREMLSRLGGSFDPNHPDANDHPAQTTSDSDHSMSMAANGAQFDEFAAASDAATVAPVSYEEPAGNNVLRGADALQGRNHSVVNFDPEQQLHAAASDALSRGNHAHARNLLTAHIGDMRQTEASCVRFAMLPLQHGEPALAAQLAQPALARFPHSAPLHRLTGAAAYQQGDYPGARVALEHALSLDKSHPLSYFLLGLTCEALDDAPAASANLREAARLDARYARR